jgi:hypothetical protein
VNAAAYRRTTMHVSRIIAIAGLAAGLSFANIACKEEGPMEKAGRTIDEAAENVQENVQELTQEDGTFEKGGEATDEAIEKMKREVEEAMEN